MAKHIENVGAEGTLKMSAEVVRRMSKDNPNFQLQVEEAQAALDAEVKMTLLEGIRKYPAAIIWSLIISTAIIMEGYDIVLLGNFYALPQFKKGYGELQSNGTYEIPAHWQTALSNGANVGEIIGLFINGIVAEKFGYRKTMIYSLICVTGFIFIPFFATSVEMLLVAELLCGIPWGIFQTLTTTYASEVCPTALRPYLTTYVNLCWVMGQLIACGVLRALINVEGHWAYRIPFALQWVWPVPIIIGTIFAPESPWWLVRQGREEDAKAAVKRLVNANTSEREINNSVSLCVHTNDMEKRHNSGTSYLDCFKGTNLRRTEITCLTWAVQITCGSGFMSYSTYFYEQAGLATESAFNMSIAQYGIGIVGTFVAWSLMGRMGRRDLYMYGLILMDACLLIIGFLSFANGDNQSAKWATAAMLLCFTFVYDVTVGPVCYSLVSEISSTRLRSKTIVLARNFYNIFGIANNFLTPYMLNPTAWNWRNRAGFFWGGACFLSLIWVYFRLPEPKGRTFSEMDILFEAETPARKFKSTSVSLVDEKKPKSSTPHDSSSDINEKTG